VARLVRNREAITDVGLRLFPFIGGTADGPLITIRSLRAIAGKLRKKRVTTPARKDRIDDLKRAEDRSANPRHARLGTHDWKRSRRRSAKSGWIGLDGN